MQNLLLQVSSNVPPSMTSHHVPLSMTSHHVSPLEASAYSPDFVYMLVFDALELIVYTDKMSDWILSVFSVSYVTRLHVTDAFTTRWRLMCRDWWYGSHG